MKFVSDRLRMARALGLATAAVAVTIVPAQPSGQAQTRTPVTFTRDIAPILQRSCQNCHRREGGGPMPLVTYEEVRPWARAIRQATGRRQMPPWFIEKNIGIQRFKDDPSLSDEEIEKIAAWADNGAPLGNPADMPPPRQFGDAGTWNIGKPDLIVSSESKVVKAVAPDWYGQLADVPTGLMEDRYVKAVEVKEVRVNEQKIERVAGKVEGDLSYFALHHAHISAAPEATDGPAGQEEADMLRRAPFYLVYEVGQNAMIYPDYLGVKLSAGSVLAFWDMHLHSVGKETSIRVDVGFKFHPKGFKPKYTQAAAQLPMTAVGKEDLDIPAGQDNWRQDGFYTMPQHGLMVTFEPHLHSSGKRMCAEAIYPNGYREMLNCSGYNHNWVKSYVYDDEAVPLLPKGTIVHMTAWYDNTAKNPRVVDPRNWKGWGNRSIDDMFFLLSRFVMLTDEEYKAEVAERAARERRPAATASQARVP